MHEFTHPLSHSTPCLSMPHASYLINNVYGALAQCCQVLFQALTVNL